MRWLALGGALVGLAFLTKMMQAFLVLPALALAYLLFAQTSWGKRLGHLLVAFGSMLLAGGWWIAIVELWPASSRPWIGGSQNNSILELTLGYNGLGRLSGNETGSVGGGGGAGGGGWGTTGILRLFNSEIGGQIAWLLPAALVLGAASLWFARRRPNVLAAITIFGTWLLVTGLTFSFMAGIFHAYYTVALAPAVAALVGIGAWVLWEHRSSLLATATLAFTVALTSMLGLLPARPQHRLRPVAQVGRRGARHGRRHSASPRPVTCRAGSASPQRSSPWWPRSPAPRRTPSAPRPPRTPARSPAPAPRSPAARGGPGGMPGGGMRGGQLGHPARRHRHRPGRHPGTGPGPDPGPGQGGTTTRTGGMGGLLNGSTSSAQVTALLQTDADAYTWTAAAVGANNAAGYQLASEQPVMAIGGFNGSDPSPTLAQFEEYVANGQVHWFIASGTGGGPGGGSNAIAEWVEANFTATTVDGTTLYDLSGGIQ